MSAPDLDAWRDATELVSWSVAPQRIWSAGERFGSWFDGGVTNLATACVDRWAQEHPERVAVHWEGEPGDRRSLTYRQLADDVRGASRGLAGLSVGPGVLVAIHLGAIPEALVAMLACAHRGAPFTVIPQSMPPEAMASRLEELAPRVLITQDGAWRRGAVEPLKARADDALSAVGSVEHTVVVRRTGIDVGWFEGDRWWHDLVAGARPGATSGDVPVAAVRADAPAVLVSVANRRGRPGSIGIGTGPLLVSAAATHRWGIADGEVIWCAGEIAWLGTQVHGIVGPLSQGVTIVLAEGTLDAPQHGRAWAILRRHAVTTLLTTPSVLRSLRSWESEVESGAEALRRVVVFGEASDVELRSWAAGLGSHDAAVSVADGWGQVELGGIVRFDAPIDPQRLPDAGLAIVGPDGEPVADGAVGEVVVTRPWAGVMVAGHDAVDPRHWEVVPGCYASGDRARREGDGLEFEGRLDEVVSVSGQLVSLAEVRALLLEHPYVAAADVVERREASGARYLLAAVVRTEQGARVASEALARDLSATIRESLGGLAKPRRYLLVDRYGDDLRGDERRAALATVPLGDAATETMTWATLMAHRG